MQAGKEPEVPLHSCCTPPGYQGQHTRRYWRCWCGPSTTWLQECFPKWGPGDTPCKHKLAGRPRGNLAALAEFNGDWKMMSEVVGLPAWNSKVGMCWRCNITLDHVAMVGEDAPCRLLSLQRKGSLSKVFDMPGFDNKLFKVDWLHDCQDGGCHSASQHHLVHVWAEPAGQAGHCVEANPGMVCFCWCDAWPVEAIAIQSF